MPTTETNLDLQGMKTFLTRQPDLILAYLFGSVARGQTHPASDVDVAVLLDPELGTEASVERQLHLAVTLDEFASREIQVTVLNRAPPLLAYSVIREGVLLYERDRSERVEFEVHAMKVYFDIKPMLEAQTQVLLERIKEVGLGRQERHPARTLQAAERVHRRLAGIAGR